MPKRFSAADMLTRSQVRQLRPNQNQATSRLVDESTSAPVDQSTGAAVNQSTHAQVHQSTSAEAAVGRYQKTAVFFAPHQRAWLRGVSRALPEGLSTSDVVRLAVERLAVDVDGGLELQPALITQARVEADRYTGRRNSGVNQLADD